MDDRDRRKNAPHDQDHDGRGGIEEFHGCLRASASRKLLGRHITASAVRSLPRHAFATTSGLANTRSPPSLATLVITDWCQPRPKECAARLQRIRTGPAAAFRIPTLGRDHGCSLDWL
jgi:hypothetical protein